MRHLEVQLFRILCAEFGKNARILVPQLPGEAGSAAVPVTLTANYAINLFLSLIDEIINTFCHIYRN